MDHNALRDQISGASRYRKLQDIKLTINGLKRNLPISIYTELEARVKEKLRTFDYPICSVANIKVIFSNGLSMTLEPEECQRAMARGVKLSDFIFSRYISARDFELRSSETMGTRNFGVFTDSVNDQQNTNTNLTPMSNSELRERVEFLMKKVESLEQIGAIYAENIPAMARDVNDLKEKVDKIYKRMING